MTCYFVVGGSGEVCSLTQNYFQNYHHIHITTSSIPPLLKCNSHIASSFLALPIVLQRRGGQDLSFPAIGRTFLESSMHTRGSINVLQLVFGLTHSNLSVYLRFGMCLIVKTFKHNPLARVSIPSVEEIETFKEAFAE